MTKKEMKELLNEKCNVSWKVLRAMRNIYGEDDVMTNNYRTEWVTYDSLYREMFNEEPFYNL